MRNLKLFLAAIIAIFIVGCSQTKEKKEEPVTTIIESKTAKDILGNPDYLAFSYGGYRQKSRDIAPTIDEIKEDMKILAAMDVKILRTYNASQFPLAANLLEAIKQLKIEDPDFEMYVMIGAWIDCQGAWTGGVVNHNVEDVENNTAEIGAAVELVKKYPEIVKIIAVGNEAMIRWAASYYVQPNVILKWVNHLQDLKKSKKIPADTWITSSDNFESWGGGDTTYRTADLVKLIKAVDFVSLHTYPYHNSHYSPEFWKTPKDEDTLQDIAKVDAAMFRAKNYAISQYQVTADYIASLGVSKSIHIGETGWSTVANSLYGSDGSKAADEYKEKLYYEYMRDWTNKAGMSCFYFEAFDEQWKDSANAEGSENHFGLIDIDGKVKYALWEMLDQGKFKDLTRSGNPLTKSYDGDKSKLLLDVFVPPAK